MKMVFEFHRGIAIFFERFTFNIEIVILLHREEYNEHINKYSFNKYSIL